MHEHDLHALTRTRRDALRAALPGRGLDAFLVFHAPNRRYLTGFRGSFGFVLVAAGGDDLMLTDWRYVSQVGEEAPGLGVVELTANKHLWTPLGSALAERGVARLGLEAKHAPHAWFEEGRAAVGVEWVATTGVVERLRARKDAYEVSRLRRAQALTDEVFAGVLPLVRPGVTERELAVAMRHRIELEGAENYPTMPIVASGWRAALPHGRASEKAVERGEFVLFDFGAIVDGYHADMTRTVACGRASPEHRALYELVAGAERDGIAAVAPGVAGRDVDRACREPLLAAGWRGKTHGYSVGHGLGLEVHEDPFLSEGMDAPLEPGMVVTVEPGVYLPGETGVRIEDTVVVTADGADVLDRSPRELLEL